MRPLQYRACGKGLTAPGHGPGTCRTREAKDLLPRAAALGHAGHEKQKDLLPRAAALGHARHGSGDTRAEISHANSHRECGR